MGLQKVYFSEKCRDPCQDESCPDPHSSCVVTDHEVQCRGNRRLNVCKLLISLLFSHYNYNYNYNNNNNNDDSFNSNNYMQNTLR